MRSIVIHVDDKPIDWHLIEPLFYKARAEKSTAFFTLSSPFSEEKCLALKEAIVDYLEREQIGRWQLVLVMHDDLSNMVTQRLSVKLAGIDEHLILPLIEAGYMPVHKIVIAGSRESEVVHSSTNVLFKLDRDGYVTDYIAEAANHFTLDEILSLDNSWGGELDLQKAGTLDTPHEEFLNDLSIRAESVKLHLSNLINGKKEKVATNPELNQCDILREDQLQEIYSEFDESVSRLIDPPLPLEMNKFKPSDTLKKIVSKNVSMDAVIEGFRVLCLRECGTSVSRKRDHLHHAAFLLNALVLYPEWIDKVRKGTLLHVSVGLDEKKIQLMYHQYWSQLKEMLGRLEDRELEDQHFSIKPFTEPEDLPNFSETLEDIECEAPVFKLSERRTFGSAWHSFLETVENKLIQREQKAVEAAKKAVWNMNVAKRQENLYQEDKLVNLNTYLETLNQKRYTLQNQLDDAPSTKASLVEWREYARYINDAMMLRLTCFPSFTIVFLSILSILLILLYPQNSLTMVQVGAELILFSFLFVIAYRKLVAPIYKLVEEANAKRDELARSQNDAQSDHNDYLNKLYQITIFSEHIKLVEKEMNKQARENMMYRWHHGKVHEHMKLAQRFVPSNQSPANINTRWGIDLSIEQDVVHNRLYSLLDTESNRKGEHHITIAIGRSKESLKADELKAVSHIELGEERVLSL